MFVVLHVKCVNNQVCEGCPGGTLFTGFLPRLCVKEGIGGIIMQGKVYIIGTGKGKPESRISAWTMAKDRMVGTGFRQIGGCI